MSKLAFLKSPSWWRHLLGFLLLLFCLGQAIAWWQSRSVARGAAPNFALPLALPVQGQNAISLDAWRTQHAGEAVVLYFWADWCPICKIQQSAIHDLMPATPVLTIATQSGSAEAVKKTLIQRQLPWLTAVDESGALWRSYGLKGVPTTIVLDDKGNISSVSVGYTSAWMLRLKIWWASPSGT